MTDFSSTYAEAMEEYRIAVREMEANDWIETDKHNYPIRQIFRDHLSVVLQNPGLPPEQKKAAWCIANCKTPEIGFNAVYCPECKQLKLHYASCNNRNCPCCQYPSQQAWIEQRKNEVIPDVPYYHIILTVPHMLNDLISSNQNLLLGTLFQCSAQAVIEMCQNQKHLGAIPGIVSVLHTWQQTLQTHFHIHMIVSGGGINGLGQFISITEKHGWRNHAERQQDNMFFLPMPALTKLFRGKMMDSVKRLMAAHRLSIPAANQEQYLDPTLWNSFCNKLYDVDWVGKIVQTFNGNGNAVDYLARYTFKTAISNGRIIRYDGTTVTIRITDRETREPKEVPIPAVEFVFRFLQHVLPSGFTRVRYSGFLANSCKTKCLSSIHRQRKLKEYTPSPLTGATKMTILKVLFQKDFSCCPSCGAKFIHLPRGRPDL